MLSTWSQTSRAARSRLPPASRDVEYKIINDSVNEICSEIKRYAQKFFNKKKVDYSACVSCFKEVCLQLTSEPKTLGEFLEAIKLCKIDQKISRKSEYEHLLNICERSREFELMMPRTRETLVTCVKDHVYKCCHSFVEETGGVDAKPVLDYEESIRNYRKDIEKHINSINADILRYIDMKSPLEKFISEGGNIGTLMETICVQIVETSHKVKQWVGDDAAYPDRLLEESVFNNSYRDKLRNQVLQLHIRQKSLERSLEQKSKICNRLEKLYYTHRMAKRKFKSSLSIVNGKLEKLESQIANNKQSIRNIKCTLSPRQTGKVKYFSPRQQKDNVSPRQHNTLTLWQQHDVTLVSPRQQMNILSTKQPKDTMKTRQQREVCVQRDITIGEGDRLHEWQITAKRQKTRLEKDLKDATEKTYETKIEYLTATQERDEVNDSLVGVHIEAKSLEERVTELDRKTAVLKHVRLLKMSPETLRKLYRRRREYHQQGQLTEACRYVSQEIGAEWKLMYGSLPFSPSREPEKLDHDIELIDRLGARRDETQQEQAWKCLDKWRTFSRRNADVAQLIRGLRKMNKLDLADKVEMRFAMEDVSE